MELRQASCRSHSSTSSPMWQSRAAASSSWWEPSALLPLRMLGSTGTPSFPSRNMILPHALQVRASFLEVYNEEVRDLLSKQARKALDVREHSSAGVYIKGLTAIVVRSASELEKVLEVRNMFCSLLLLSILQFTLL